MYDKNGETINASRQRLSKCGVCTWPQQHFIQSGKLWKRRTVRKPKPHKLVERPKLMLETMLLETQSVTPHTTLLDQDELSRNLKDLLRKITTMGYLIKEGEVVRHHVYRILI